MEREISEIRSANQKLGKSVSWIVDMLLQDEEGVKDPDRLKDIQGRKREALEALAYVRDVLTGGITNIEEERLWSEHEFRKRSRELASQQTRGTSSSFPRHDNQLISKPPPASISDLRGSRQAAFTPSVHEPSFTSSRPLHSHSTALSASAPGSSPPPVSPTKSLISGTRPTGPQTLPQWASLPQRPPPASATLHSPRGTAPTSAPPSTGNKTFVQHDPLGVL